MILKEVVKILDQTFKIKTAEGFDNVGLLCGNPEREVTGILVCHDALEHIIDEAIEKGVNVIAVFHPIIFSGLKSITGKNYVERAVLKAIENKIAIYAIHTAFDNDYYGVNFGICEALQLENQRILMPKYQSLKRLDVYVPQTHIEQVRDALLDAGAGSIGFYDDCSFTVKGQGSFRPIEGSKPFLGNTNEREYVDEEIISVIVENHLLGNVIGAMLQSHPYEEVAHQIIPLDNAHHYMGLGRYGDLKEEMDEKDFLNMVKNTFNLQVIRHSEFNNKKIKRVGVLGGSGSSGIGAAQSVGCDAYLTGDITYHQFYQAENRMLICDIGHFESEQFVMHQIFEILSEKFPKFAVSKTILNTNPVNYYL